MAFKYLWNGTTTNGAQHYLTIGTEDQGEFDLRCDPSTETLEVNIDGPSYIDRDGREACRSVEMLFHGEDAAEFLLQIQTWIEGLA